MVVKGVCFFIHLATPVCLCKCDLFELGDRIL